MYCLVKNIAKYKDSDFLACLINDQQKLQKENIDEKNSEFLIEIVKRRCFEYNAKF